MPLRKKPPRRRHPDPGVELQLQRIRDLRASIDRRTKLITDYRQDIDSFHSTVRAETNKDRIGLYNKRADELDNKIRVLETEIEQTGSRIADLQAKIDPADLAWLW